MIVVVGAGIAGLYVASELVKKGNKVLVLEKDAILGGRIHTGHHGPDSYEIGAGRIHVSHKRVLALLKRFNLKTVNINGPLTWRALGSSQSMPNLFDPTWLALLTQIRRLEPSVLGRSTLRELAMQILGPSSATALLELFSYRTELESMRADVALREFGLEHNYSVVIGGLSQLIDGLAKGLDIRLSTKVTNVTHKEGVYTVHVKDGADIVADRVVLAIPVTGLRSLPVMRGLKALEYVGMAPLIRIYAKYPTPAWFTQDDRTVTDSPLRYIIPISTKSGVVMISYTDGRDTGVWAGLTGPALTTKIQEEVRRLFPERVIPEPLWLTPYEWHEGVSYWKPGAYDPVTESAAVLRPRAATMPDLFTCGESFSMLQEWMEGSLEHADALLDIM